MFKVESMSKVIIDSIVKLRRVSKSAIAYLATINGSFSLLAGTQSPRLEPVKMPHSHVGPEYISYQ
jgi:hypothetical protein